MLIRILDKCELIFLQNKFSHNADHREILWDWKSIKYNRIALVNLLLSKFENPKYLEIGCASNSLFHSVFVKGKVGVDPASGGTIRKTSDEFFKKNRMKFDVVLGNPPYQKKVGTKKTEPIWNKFVEKSFDICKEGGHVSMIHPSGWRDVKGNFSNIKNLLKSKKIIYLNMNDFNKGKEVFNVGTNFDWYVIQNISDNKNITQLSTVDGKLVGFDLTRINYIPSGMIDSFNKIVAKTGEESVNVVYSRSDYGTDKSHMNVNETDNNQHPCVYTITTKNGINFFYSTNKDNGHFGVKKLIWSNGLGTYPILDLEGNYGLTQFSYAIIDEPENLFLIKKVMESDIFINLMTYVKFTNNKYHYKVISTFRKDFWKEFLDEDGNIIEPNLNQNVEQL
jgi:hypothetical protein